MAELKLNKRNHSEMFFELTAPEGSDYVDFKINRYGYAKTLVTWYGENDKRKNKTLYLYVKVVGFIDKKSKIRNWGKFSKKYG